MHKPAPTTHRSSCKQLAACAGGKQKLPGSSMAHSDANCPAVLAHIRNEFRPFSQRFVITFTYLPDSPQSPGNDLRKRAYHRGRGGEGESAAGGQCSLIPLRSAAPAAWP